jgi:hypothetical protein
MKRGIGVREQLQVPVDASTQPNGQDEDKPDIIIDPVDDPVVANADAIRVLESCHLAAPVRARILFEAVYVRFEGVAGRSGKRQERLLRGALPSDGIRHL